VAASGLILMQAGGKISDFIGGNSWTDAQQVVATNGLLHNDILQLLH